LAAKPQGDTLSKEKVSKVIRKKTDSIVRGETKKTIGKQLDTTIKGEIRKGKTADNVVKVASFSQKPVNNADSNGVIRVERITHQTGGKLPPPEGYNPGFRNLYTYLLKHIRYPAHYFDKKIVDNVVAEFTVDANHKVSGCKITNDAKPLFADEVTRQLKGYPDTVEMAPGTYFFLVQFNLMDDDRNPTRTWLPSGEYLKLTAKPDCAGNLELIGYVNGK